MDPIPAPTAAVVGPALKPKESSSEAARPMEENVAALAQFAKTADSEGNLSLELPEGSSFQSTLNSLLSDYPLCVSAH